MGKVIGSLVLLGIAAVAGVLMGQSAANDSEDASRIESAARIEAFTHSKKLAIVEGREAGLKRGRAVGKKAAAKTGTEDGSAAGLSAAETEIAEAEAAAAAAAAAEAESQLEYTDELPHGEPGYLLPESERSIACVGYDADTGECVGD